MNEHIFQSYIDNITQHFGISQKYIFSKGKKLNKTQPRQLFFYLCNKKGIPVVSIQRFLEKNSFKMHHATIFQSIKRIGEIVEGDPDYTPLIKKLEKVSENV
jgi:chromosomal replication initiation ATPase DnaA|tara:strand:+ start:791 stop:1096 length:306 start_codon:yes stop_codon:yes gene_type:complete